MGFWIVTVVGILAGAGLTWHEVRSRKLRRADFDQTVGQLQPLPVAQLRAIGEIARDFLDPASVKRRQKCSQIWLEPEDIWACVGEEAGLEKLGQNAEVMIRLAACVYRWDLEETYVVSQRLRRDALQLKRALRRVRIARFAARLGFRDRRMALELQQAVASYHLMRERLLLLYETKQYLKHERLTQVL